MPELPLLESELPLLLPLSEPPLELDVSLELDVPLELTPVVLGSAVVVVAESSVVAIDTVVVGAPVESPELLPPPVPVASSPHPTVAATATKTNPARR